MPKETQPAHPTYSLCMPIELTRLCASACDFCPYPFTAHEPLASISRVRKAMRKARHAGATLVDLVSGEQPDAYPEMWHVLQYYGFASFTDYLMACAETARPSATGEPALPVRLDTGVLPARSWAVFRKRFSSAKLLLTSLDEEVISNGALKNAETQNYETRLESIVEAGAAGMPLTSGTMIGIGESSENRERAIKVVAAIARKFGHIRAFLLQAFRPHPATPMAQCPPTALGDMLEAVAMARRFLPSSAQIQINALDWPKDLESLVDAGVTDLGDLNLKVLSRQGKVAEMELQLLFEPLEKKGVSPRLRRPRLPLQTPASAPGTAA